MRILYGKIGRSHNLDITKASVAGGDIDVIRALQRLAVTRPEDEFVLIGRNTGENPQDVGLPANVVNWWTPERREEFKQRTPRKSPMTREQQQNVIAVFDDMTGPVFDSADAVIMWAGQHGTSNTPLPPIGKRDETPTNPQDAFVLYCSFLMRGINRWRTPDPHNREEIWLVPDPRNYLKFRDCMWPYQRPIIGQYQERRKTKHERYGDPQWPSYYGFPEDRAWYDEDEPGLWKSHVDYIYGALELTALPSPSLLPHISELVKQPRYEFGVISNENRPNVSVPRAPLIKSWVLDQFPDCPLYGIWTAKGQEALGREVAPVPYPLMLPTMRTLRATCTFPASGSKWATAKPWEAFASGTICFFHPRYDEQDHILRDAPQALHNFLRIDSKEQLLERVRSLTNDYPLYQYMAYQQYEHYLRRFTESRGGIHHVLERLERITPSVLV